MRALAAQDAGERRAVDRDKRLSRTRDVLPSRTGVSFDALLSFEAWRTVGARIGAYSSASAWWLADWLVFGQMKYGRRYREAISVTGLDYQTLRNYAVVARRFEVSRRRDTLTFQHHAELCALPDAEQDRWLDLASTHRWTRSELRRQLRASRAAVAQPTGLLRLDIGTERELHWRTAAERSRCALEEWMTRILDEAARVALLKLKPPADGRRESAASVTATRPAAD
jgi:hypothetical protein